LSFGGWTLFWISCSALLIFGSALYFTKSHGAWFGVAGAFVIVWILRRVSNTVRAFVLTAVVACGIVLPFAAVWYWPHAQAALNIPDRSSAASRVTIWRSAIAIGRDYPVFGIGPGSFQAQYLRYQKNYPPYLEWAVPQPHNTYLAFWLQTGALGLVGFVLLLVWFFGALSPSLGYTRGKLRWESRPEFEF